MTAEVTVIQAPDGKYEARVSFGEGKERWLGPYTYLKYLMTSVTIVVDRGFK